MIHKYIHPPHTNYVTYICHARSKNQRRRKRRERRKNNETLGKKGKLDRKQGFPSPPPPPAQNISVPIAQRAPHTRNFLSPFRYFHLSRPPPQILSNYPGVERIVVARSVSAAPRLIQTRPVTLASVDSL